MSADPNNPAPSRCTLITARTVQWLMGAKQLIAAVHRSHNVIGQLSDQVDNHPVHAEMRSQQVDIEAKDRISRVSWGFTGTVIDLQR